MKKSTERLIMLACVLAIIALNFYFSIFTTRYAGGGAHFLAASFLTLTTAMYLCEGHSFSLYRGLGFAALITFLFGVGLEVAHYFLPHRVFDVYDIVANLIGIAFASVVYVLRYKYVLKK